MTIKNAAPAPDGTFSVKLDVPLSTELLDGVIVTAVEGGTGYWAYVEDYEHNEDPQPRG